MNGATSYRRVSGFPLSSSVSRSEAPDPGGVAGPFICLDGHCLERGDPAGQPPAAPRSPRVACRAPPSWALPGLT